MNRRVRLGVALARLHQGALSADAPPVHVPRDLEDDVVRLALGASAGSLAYRRLATASKHPRLRDAYRLHTLEATDRACHVAEIAACLAAGRIDALFFKGWTLAHRYPLAALRPHGDVDVLVRPADHLRARQRLGAARLDRAVDLQTDLELPGASFTTLFARRRSIPLRGIEIPMLADDAHLAFLCLHFLKHGGTRPMWLVDITLLAEHALSGVAWWGVLARDPARAHAARSVADLASVLVGSGDAAPVAPWMVAATLEAWGSGFHRPSRLFTFDTLANLARDLRERWPNALQTLYLAPPRSIARAPHLGRRGRAFLQKAIDRASSRD